MNEKVDNSGLRVPLVLYKLNKNGQARASFQNLNFLTFHLILMHFLTKYYPSNLSELQIGI
jgi:hypothetical protein